MKQRKHINFDYAIHSDFLIHWTGKDFDNKDQKGDPIWCKPGESKSKTTDETQSYIKRLHNTLKYGLWMTEEDEEPLNIGEDIIPKTCFTELKLSESRKHAKFYGRLGIGVKRPFLFKRLGRPVVYYLCNNNDTFLKNCVSDLKDKTLLNFFKPMNRDNRTLIYDLYAESEWRILFCQELLTKNLIKDPRDAKNKKENEYFKTLTSEEKKKLKYLIPLDGWFAMIIYPSLDVKNKAQQDDSTGIKQQIKRIKDLNDEGNRVENKNWPIEIDLDACRNF